MDLKKNYLFFIVKKIKLTVNCLDDDGSFELVGVVVAKPDPIIQNKVKIIKINQ